MHLEDAHARRLVLNAVETLYARDRDLPPDVHERTVTGLLARYIAEQLVTDGREWHVDVEYNRLGAKPKTLAGLADLLNADSDLVVPDIIVHRRGSQTSNVMVLEVKRLGAAAAKVERDLVKLSLFREQLRYEHAFLLLLADTAERSRLLP